MENLTTKRKVLRHLLALVTSTAFLTVVPIALYAALIVWSGDMGGPLNLFIIPVASGFIGFNISLIIFLPLALFAERSSFQGWLRAFGYATGALVTVIVPGWIYVGLTKPAGRWPGLVSAAGSVCLYFIAGFFVYLCCLAVCRRRLP